MLCTGQGKYSVINNIESDKDHKKLIRENSTARKSDTDRQYMSANHTVEVTLLLNDFNRISSLKPRSHCHNLELRAITSACEL